jgi:hypothetical protein
LFVVAVVVVVRGECARVYLLFAESSLLLRIRCASGVHRAPTVALTVAGLLRYERMVADVDVFPLSLAWGNSRQEPAQWSDEVARLNKFLTSEA